MGLRTARPTQKDPVLCREGIAPAERSSALGMRAVQRKEQQRAPSAPNFSETHTAQDRGKVLGALDSKTDSEKYEIFLVNVNTG